MTCLCTGRTDIVCNAVHCDLAGPGAPGDANECRICWLRLGSVGNLSRRERNQPCLFLGEVMDKLDCPCPAQWLRACAIHKVCTLTQCKICVDYQPE